MAGYPQAERERDRTCCEALKNRDLRTLQLFLVKGAGTMANKKLQNVVAGTLLGASLLGVSGCASFWEGLDSIGHYERGEPVPWKYFGTYDPKENLLFSDRLVKRRNNYFGDDEALFIANIGISERYGEHRLFVADKAGNNQKLIAGDQYHDVVDADWLPDGRIIFETGKAILSGRLYFAINADGSNQRSLSEGEYYQLLKEAGIKLDAEGASQIGKIQQNPEPNLLFGKNVRDVKFYNDKALFTVAHDVAGKNHYQFLVANKDGSEQQSLAVSEPLGLVVEAEGFSDQPPSAYWTSDGEIICEVVEKESRHYWMVSKDGNKKEINEALFTALRNQSTK